MAWWNRSRSERGGVPLTERPPARAQRGSGGERPRIPGPAPGAPAGWSRGEHQVITDGQLGSANLERAPEYTNPEGSVDIPNTDYWERGDRRRR